MKFDDLIKRIAYISYKKQNDSDINDITNNSQYMDGIDSFAAIKGNVLDGHKYIEDAIAKGAKTIVHSEDIDYVDGINYIKVADSRKATSDISNILEDYPSKKMTVVGVTGTNGKTTTSSLIYFLMKEIYGKATNIGTDGAFVNGARTETPNTTPDIFFINKVLNESLDQGIDKVVIESSSHGLSQNRLNGIDFDYGVFTNLSTEHLDYHKTMDGYFDAKMKLFEVAKVKIANFDDLYGRKAKERFADVISYGTSDDADYVAYDIKKNDGKTTFFVKDQEFTINTIADYELYNSLAAITVLSQMGNDLGTIADNLVKFKGIPSRFQYIENDLGKNIVIDFAHTPVAFDSLFKSIPQDVRTYAVFGVNGDRNEEFRRLTGNICAKNDVFVVATTDDNKFDTFENITNDLIKGIEEFGGDYRRIEDRKEAIKWAISQANEGDYIVMLGKGEERFLKHHGNEKTYYNEYETVLEAIKDQ